MSKPAKPVSLAPVKALSAVDTGKPAFVAPALMPAAAASPVADAPAAVSAPVPAPAPKAAVTTAVAAPKAVVPKTLAPVAFASKSEAPQAAAPQAVPPPAVKAVAKPAAKVASPKVAVAKPAAARSSAPKTSAPKTSAPKTSTPKVAATGVVAAPRVVAAPVAASKPAASKPAAGDLFAPMFDMQAMMPSLTSFQLPGFTAADLKSPALGGGMLAAMTGQMLAATRAMGDIQAILLDHGCAELKAGLIELEACARSTSPSEVVTIHARVVRRSADALTDTIKVVSDTARKSLTRR
jgi:hypothetical protein